MFDKHAKKLEQRNLIFFLLLFFPLSRNEINRIKEKLIVKCSLVHSRVLKSHKTNHFYVNMSLSNDWMEIKKKQIMGAKKITYNRHEWREKESVCQSEIAYVRTKKSKTKCMYESKWWITWAFVNFDRINLLREENNIFLLLLVAKNSNLVWFALIHFCWNLGKNIFIAMNIPSYFIYNKFNCQNISPTNINYSVHFVQTHELSLLFPLLPFILSLPLFYTYISKSNIDNLQIICSICFILIHCSAFRFHTFFLCFYFSFYSSTLSTYNNVIVFDNHVFFLIFTHIYLKPSRKKKKLTQIWFITIYILLRLNVIHCTWINALIVMLSGCLSNLCQTST